MPLSIVEQDGRIAVSTPYHPNFPAKARSLGGVWDAARRLWLFDAGDHDRVKSLCREIYGTGGLEDGKDGMAPFPQGRRARQERVRRRGDRCAALLRPPPKAARADDCRRGREPAGLRAARNAAVRRQPARRCEADGEVAARAFRWFWRSDERRPRRAVGSRARSRRHRRDQIGARGGAAADAPRIAGAAGRRLMGQADRLFATPRSRTTRSRNSTSCSSTARMC